MIIIDIGAMFVDARYLVNGIFFLLFFSTIYWSCQNFDDTLQKEEVIVGS